MFIHWGPYAVLGGEWEDRNTHGEWTMRSADIPFDQYEVVVHLQGRPPDVVNTVIVLDVEGDVVSR